MSTVCGLGTRDGMREMPTCLRAFMAACFAMLLMASSSASADEGAERQADVCLRDVRNGLTNWSSVATRSDGMKLWASFPEIDVYEPIVARWQAVTPPEAQKFIQVIGFVDLEGLLSLRSDTVNPTAIRRQPFGHSQVLRIGRFLDRAVQQPEFQFSPAAVAFDRFSDLLGGHSERREPLVGVPVSRLVRGLLPFWCRFHARDSKRPFAVSRFPLSAQQIEAVASWVLGVPGVSSPEEHEILEIEDRLARMRGQ